MAKAKSEPKAPTIVNDVPAAPVSTCKCGSTRRTDYHNTTQNAIDGLKPDGTPYNRVTQRRCECLDCGQCRIDRTFDLVAEDSQAD